MAGRKEDSKAAVLEANSADVRESKYRQSDSTDQHQSIAKIEAPVEKVYGYGLRVLLKRKHPISNPGAFLLPNSADNIPRRPCVSGIG